MDLTIQIFIQTQSRESFTNRKFNSIKLCSLTDHLFCRKWRAIDNIKSDLEAAMNLLNSYLKSANNILALLKMFCPTKKHALWFWRELRELAKKQDATHRLYKRSRRADLLKEFRLNIEVVQAKQLLHGDIVRPS